jgi:hypothetical protein
MLLTKKSPLLIVGHSSVMRVLSGRTANERAAFFEGRHLARRPELAHSEGFEVGVVIQIEGTSAASA